MDDLGTRLARGDPAAYAELYDRCADCLYPNGWVQHSPAWNPRSGKSWS